MTTRIRRRGRPCELSPQKEKLLLSAIRRGLPYKQATALAGISYMTFNRWRKKGSLAGAPPELRDFCNRLEAAEAKAADTLLKAISKAGRTRDWRAAAWILERRYPQEWTQREYVPPPPTFDDVMEDYPPKTIEAIYERLISLKKRFPDEPPAATGETTSNFATVAKSE